MSLQIPQDEEAAIRERFWHPRAGEVVLDIGSFLGTYAIPSLLADANVYAVDGRRQTLGALHELAKALGVASRLTLLHRTVYDGGPYPSALLEAIANSQYESSRDMAPAGPPVTLDHLVKSQLALERVDWVKVDVEGGELGVMRGARDTLERLRPRWLIEDHSRVYPWVATQRVTEQLLEIFEEANYTVEVVAEPYTDYIVGWPQ